MASKSSIRSKCDNHEVRSLAWTRWDAKTGQWKIVGGHDTAYCRDCGTVLSVKTGKPFRKKGHFPPNLEGGNDRRAERARATIAAYEHCMDVIDSPNEPRVAVGDLLADLMHYWDRYGGNGDFCDALEGGAGHYEEETSENLADALGVAEVVDCTGEGKSPIKCSALLQAEEHSRQLERRRSPCSVVKASTTQTVKRMR